MTTMAKRSITHVLRSATGRANARMRSEPKPINYAGRDSTKSKPYHATKSVARQSKITLPPTPWDKETS